jgi:hypothetical protein
MGFFHGTFSFCKQKDHKKKDLLNRICVSLLWFAFGPKLVHWWGLCDTVFILNVPEHLHRSTALSFSSLEDICGAQYCLCKKKIFAAWCSCLLPSGRWARCGQNTLIFTCRVILEYVWLLSSFNIVKRDCFPPFPTTRLWVDVWHFIFYVVHQNFEQCPCTHLSHIQSLFIIL